MCNNCDRKVAQKAVDKANKEWIKLVTKDYSWFEKILYRFIFRNTKIFTLTSYKGEQDGQD